MQFQWDQLRALAAAVSEGSFEGAAVALHITASAVSQRIKALESQAGRVLVRRTKPVRPTEAGVPVLRLARQLDLLTGDAVRAMSGVAAPMVTIPVVVNADSLDTWVLPALVDIPGVVLELHREDQDHSTVLLRDGSVMAAITATAQPVQGCSVARLGAMRYRVMASSSFRDRWFADGVTAAALSEAPVVVFDRKDQLQDRYLVSRGVSPMVPPRHFVPASAGFAQAVRLGLGWGMLPDLQIGDGVGLVELDVGGVEEVPLYWQQWRMESVALTALAEAVTRAAALGLR